MKTTWVTFDCYGTLIDWESGIRRFLATLPGVRDPEGLLAEWEEIQFQMIRGPYRTYREILAASLREAQARRRLPYHPQQGADFAEALCGWMPFPDTNPALEKLRARGIKLGIISNIDDALLELTLRHFTVPFDLLVTAQQSRAYKPDAASFRLALERIGGSPSEVTHVAFGERYDLDTARACGMQVVFIARNGKEISFRADAAIPTLERLPELFE
jgi:2-haloalkanoic acid dehalogenase type II